MNGSSPQPEVTFEASSHIDPFGRLFSLEGRLFRGIRPPHGAFYEALLQDGTAVSGMIRDGRVVATWMDEAISERYRGIFDVVFGHKRIEPVSYCYEWPAPMLRDAALLTLDLAIELVAAGLALQDASPWNVVFEHTRPVFVDFSSITPPPRSLLWPPYHQFCRLFLNPLYLSASGLSGFARAGLMHQLRNGVSTADTARAIPWRHALRLPGFIKHVRLPSRVAGAADRIRRRGQLDRLSERLSASVDMGWARARFLAGLRSTVRRLPLGEGRSAWSDYYESTDAMALERKKRLVGELLARLAPRTVLDCGCNTGEFSVMAAGTGASVIAFDIDETSVSRLYRRAAAERLRILPLVMNIVSPSPALGWRTGEFPAAADRLRADLVFVFALIHHLVFVEGQDFGRVIAAVKDHQRQACVFEFVAFEDAMVQRLPKRVGLDYGWYTLEGFTAELHRNYPVVEHLGSPSPTRHLLLATI